MDSKVSKLIAELIVALPGFNPLDIPKEGNNGAERFALANMYKDKAFRDYMIRNIYVNIGKLQHVEDEKGLYIQQGRVATLKELFAISKQMFNESEKIEKTFLQ